ncbi:LuxR family transcriptional regulator [Puniceibacterium sp. IMCC21224]|uniref:helix-turn-helix transcriptional regulator n=1 Tax=Puniceibacterium sp. IMCC21224 TaxID=1618204 RepID=UPI00064DE264|nr:LuxR family transcriptional regulator [Puniceibacterium sp. IMCC21224]
MQISDWVTASAEVVSALGSPRFAEALTDAMRVVVPFEFTVIFAYYRDSRPLDIYDNFPTEKRQVMVDDYQEGPYLLDPFYLHSAAPTTTRLVRLRDLAPDRFYQAEYFRNYYVQTGLAEEIGFIIDVGDNVSVVISAMREHKAFSAREFRDLQAIVPFVAVCAQRHWDGLLSKFSDRPQSEGPRLSKLIDESFQRFGRNLLTPREAEIVEYTLKGYSAESTGNALGIATGTVRIHRRNIYGKLGVSSQGELFSNFIASLDEI